MGVFSLHGKTLHENPDGWVLMISPRRSLVAQLVAELRDPTRSLGLLLEFCQGNGIFNPATGKSVRVASAAVVLDSLATSDEWVDSLKQLKLVVLENLDISDADYEWAVSILRLRCHGLPVRFVGSPASLDDPGDLSTWLQVDNSALYNPRPPDRDTLLTIIMKTFTTPPSSALHKAMAKPAHSALASYPDQPAIIFVPSSNHCRSAAVDLITEYTLADLSIRRFIPPHIDQNELEFCLTKLQDRTLSTSSRRVSGSSTREFGRRTER